jgi:16S rRNA (cytidine1402-2'-O)-methyltransferase
VTEREPPGEIVLVLAGAPEAAPPGDEDIVAAVRSEMAAGSSARDAARTVASRLDVPRRRAYEIASALPAPRP